MSTNNQGDRSPDAIEYLLLLRLMDYLALPESVQEAVDDQRCLPVRETLELFLKARRGEIELY